MTLNRGRVWCTLITNQSYLPGVRTLIYSLFRVHTSFPFLILYTAQLDTTVLGEIDKLVARYDKVDKLEVPPIKVERQKDFGMTDQRFIDTWTKLQVFGLVSFDRAVLLDADMVVLQNMDELLSWQNDHLLPLCEDLPVAACHACVCNPLNRAHYPRNWMPSNCAWSFDTDDGKSMLGPPCDKGLGILNSGLLVVKPSMHAYQRILALLQNGDKTASYTFPDQELITEAFYGKWIGLSYKYNALKTLRTQHANIWRDDRVKNVHYILTPKPWQVDDPATFDDPTGTLRFWYQVDEERSNSI